MYSDLYASLYKWKLRSGSDNFLEYITSILLTVVQKKISFHYQLLLQTKGSMY